MNREARKTDRKLTKVNKVMSNDELQKTNIAAYPVHHVLLLI